MSLEDFNEDIDRKLESIGNSSDFNKNFFENSPQVKKKAEPSLLLPGLDFDDENSLTNLNENDSQINSLNNNFHWDKAAYLFGTKNSDNQPVNDNTNEPNPSVKVNENIKIDKFDTLISNKSSATAIKPLDKIKTTVVDPLEKTVKNNSLKITPDKTVVKTSPMDEQSMSTSMPNLSKSEQNIKPQAVVTNSTTFNLSSTVREPRRGRPKSNLIDDPLGLLTASKSYQQVTEIKNETQQNKEEKIDKTLATDLPEWLGGTKKKTDEIINLNRTDNIKINEEKSQTQSIQKNTNHQNYPDLSQLAKSNEFEQAAISTMQQQEHELKTAVLLAQQTEQLNFIAENQKNKLNQQEKIFDSFIKQQIERQSALENQIKTQQARIDNYIQELMKQPVTVTSSLSMGNNDSNSKNNDDENAKVNLQHLLHTMEVEKNSSDHVVEILKEKHEKEIQILRQSHETQIHIMQEDTNKLEEKFHQEIENLQIYYEKKIERLMNEKNEQEIYLKNELKNFKLEKEAEIKEIHNRHSEQITQLQKEYSMTIENITYAKELEKHTLDFLNANKNNLDSMLMKSNNIFEELLKLSDDIKKKDDKLISKQEDYLKSQDENIKAQLNQLNAQQESLNKERRELVLATQKISLETSELKEKLEKNLQLCNDKEIRLEKSEKNLIREKELHEERVKSEQEYLQSLKEAWVTDYKHQMQMIAKEKEEIASEKAKLNVLNSLKINSDEITKAELESALKAAHNVTKEVNLERQKWQEKINNLMDEKLQLETKEKNLMKRAKDLEDLTQAALMKREEGLKALREAQRIEKQYKDRINQLQTQLESLTERENKVAADKISLARERLALKINESISDQSKSIIIDNEIINNERRSASQIHTHFKDIVDPQMLLLKLNLDNKLNSCNNLLSQI